MGKILIRKNENALVAEITGLYQGVYSSDGSGGRIQALEYKTLTVEL
jgi:hypothetical protein